MELLIKPVVKEVEPDADANTDRILQACAVSFGSGLTQGICVLLMAANSVKAFLGITSTAAASGSSLLHADVVRIPLMVVAGITATFTLYVIWNGWHMRNSTAAKWRKRPLSWKEKLSIVSGLFFSILSLLLIAGELVAHRILHGS